MTDTKSIDNTDLMALFKKRGRLKLKLTWFKTYLDDSINII